MAKTNARVDLHAHTNASDGEHSPEELIQIARERGVTFLGIADHDTLAGLERAVAAATQAGDIQVIPALGHGNSSESQHYPNGASVHKAPRTGMPFGRVCSATFGMALL